ncbi:amino acid transporter AVT1I-like [Musa acuminata AAA Group]|uniref:amino acid transporter AVT1I-like n=1 Tax=Musa acuminata AAA Group TaxID=214697 RepID=UPI0031D4879B
MTDPNEQFVVVIKEDDAADLRKSLLQTHSDDGFLSSRTSNTKHGTSFARTCLNLSNAISGIGVLSLPYALSLGGWLSLAIFVLVSSICYYTGLLIQRCLDADPCIKTYPDIGEYAFGRKGKLVISIFMYLELYLVAVGFLIMEGDNLDKLFPGVCLKFASVSVQGKQLFILLSALVILPTTWPRNLGILAYVSAGGVLASAVLLGSLLWAGIADTGFHEKGRILDLNGLPTAMGLFFMCFTCHAVFPTISSSMRDSTRFPKVVSISFVLCTINYALMAILGYLMYGEKLESQVTLNLPAGEPYTRIAIYTTLINPITKFALAMSPISGAIEQQLALCRGRMPGKMPSLLIRTLLLCGTVVIALAIPFFAYLMAFVGSFLSVVVSVLFPCLCYLKIHGVSQVRRLELVNILGIVVVGSLVAVIGTYSSLRDIICNR